MTIPATHASEGLKLQADGIVELWEIQLKPSGTICVKNDQSVTWQGKTYDSLPVKIEGVSTDSSEKRSRPTLSVANPNDIFTGYVGAGVLDKALVYRRRVLYADVLANRNVAQVRLWIVGQVLSLKPGVSVTIELRSLSDGPNFMLPARTFTAPEFRVVSLA